MKNNRCQRINELKTYFGSNEYTCKYVLDRINLLSNKNRFRILCVLSKEECNVGEICELINGKISNVSQQLKMLQLSGLIDSRVESRNHIYYLKDDSIRALIAFLESTYSTPKKEG